jgi:SAM-dependent methyltransferase
MRALSYIKYFIFLARNWDFKIARHVFRSEIKGEKKYDIFTTGADELESLEEKGIDTDHATIYMPVSYHLLEEVLQAALNLPVKPGRHFLDIGCGKGRALCVAAHFGFTKITGIDFSKELADEAAANLKRTRQQFPGLQYQVYNNDAFYFEIPDDADCIFLFNPFDEVIMSGVVFNLLESLKRSQRTVTIIYVNSLHKEAFTMAGFTEVYYKKTMQYLEVSVLQNQL